jgi:tetratricopeptide (TPR) repeat protein
VEILVGHGDPIRAGSPFGMIAPAIRRAAGIAPDEPLDVRRKKLRARVGRHVARADLARVSEFVGELAGVPFDDAESIPLRAARRDPQLMGDQMRRAFEDLLAAESAAQPVVIVLEDLQWGDLPSVRFVDLALKNLAGAPLFVLALARPEVRASFPDLFAARAPAEIPLGALAPREAERLARAALGDAVDPATVARIVELAAGNAFYLEELIRAVAAGRRDALPETVVASVQAVLEDLDPEARRVLRAGSIFGKSFGAAGIAALAGLSRADVDRHLDRLVAREVLTRRAPGEGQAEGGDELVFRHAHVREAAYATLTDADRELGHRLAGAFLERVERHDPALLAEHFQRGGDLARAVAWYRAAAEEALQANDLARVVAWVDRAVECGAEGEAYGALRLVAAEANRWLGKSREALLSAIDAVRELPPGSASWLTAVSEIGANAMRTGDVPALLQAAEDLASLPDPPPDLSAARVLACTRLAAPLFLLGKGDLADRLMATADALAVGRAAEDPAVRSRVLETRALEALVAGLSGEFLALATAAAVGFTEYGDLRNAAVQRTNVGSVFVSLGAYPEAERELTDVLATAERVGLAQIAAAARQNLALALAREGRVDEARAMAAAGIADARAQNNRRLEIGARILASIIAPDPATAAREAQAAVDLAEGPMPQRAYALGALAMAVLGEGRAAAAITAADEAMSILEAAGGMDEGEALVRLAHAETRLAAGDEAGARRALAAARQRLAERAAKIADASLRASFLERVPENRRTLVLHASLGMDR